MEGRYKIVLSTPMGVEQGVLDIFTNGSNASGAIMSSKINTRFTNGIITGDSISFSGMIRVAIVSVYYSANCTIVDGNLSGTVRTKYGEFRVRGEKI